jgi:hypothetical protein
MLFGEMPRSELQIAEMRPSEAIAGVSPFVAIAMATIFVSRIGS